jgi:hypothetical protein
MNAIRPHRINYSLPAENEFQIMLVRLKVLLVLSCLWTALSCAADNYGVNPAARVLVDELVAEEGFDREQLLKVFADAERKESMRTGRCSSTASAKTRAWNSSPNTGRRWSARSANSACRRK